MFPYGFPFDKHDINIDLPSENGAFPQPCVKSPEATPPAGRWFHLFPELPDQLPRLFGPAF